MIPSTAPIGRQQASFIGVDLGGTQLRAAAVDAAGAMLDVRRVATDRGGPSAVIGQIDELIGAVRRADTRSVCIGIPCALDGRSGTIPAIPALPGWRDVPLAAILAERTGLDIILENDAKCATVGEWRRGAARGCRDFVYVTISTGIGAGIVADNALLRGHGGLAGEIGHTRIADRSARCDCGQRGCWQAIASGTALASAGADAVARYPASLLARIAHGRVPDGRHIQAAAEQHCPVAKRVLRREARALAWGFTNLQHLYAPEMIVVGGGVSQALPLMVEDIRAEMRRRLLPSYRLAEIVPAALKDDAGIIGAAMVAKASTAG